MGKTIEKPQTEFIQKKESERQEVKCPKCGHPFKTKSKLGLISCNDCGAKFKREENLVSSKSQRKLK